jgi:MraZ protein
LVVTRFVGRYEHSLDVKGRIILPARFRNSFETAAYLSKHEDRCLALWTPQAFEHKLDQMEEIQDSSPEERAKVRAWAAGSAEIELDRQGRVAIPGHMREFARLETAVLVHGAIGHIEIWNPDEWAVRGAPGEADLADPPRPASVPASIPSTPVVPPPNQ